MANENKILTFAIAVARFEHNLTSVGTIPSIPHGNAVTVFHVLLQWQYLSLSYF